MSGWDADRSVDDVERARDRLRGAAREVVGVTGDDRIPPLRQSVAGVGWYPLGALGVLAVVDQLHGYAFVVLAPDISRSLGISKGAFAALLSVLTLAAALAPLPVAALAQRPRRALLSLVAALVWSLANIGNAFVVTVWGLLAVLLLDGLTSGAVAAVHAPLLVDTYRPGARLRVLSAYQAIAAVGSIAAPLVVALLAALGYTWRGVLLTTGLLSLAGTACCLRLRDPGFGRWDTERIRAAVHDGGGGGAHEGTGGAAAVGLGFFEITRRVLLVPTIRKMLAANAVVGVLLIPFQTFLFFFLRERWGLGATARGFFFAWLALASIASLAAFGARGEVLFRRDPAKVVRLAALLLAIGVGMIAAAGLAPRFWLSMALFGLAAALLAPLTPAFAMTVMSLVPASMRPHAAALLGVFLGGVGGLLGAVFLSGIDRRYGLVGAMVSLLVPGLAGALVLRSAARFVHADLDRMIDETIEAEEVERLRVQGRPLPLLVCRGVDFSYGHLQVLFGVDFRVDDGEVVALLGVNGAGKSTLLRVLAGLSLPQRGAVRLDGRDITYVDAERRLHLGIATIPGGRAVFAPLTVADNLRLFGHALGRDRRAADAAIESAFALFPRLAERRNQLASTLSGGEQQMLALARAIILRPRLLLVDELSLGLAPAVVRQLLGAVRQINAAGTAVVLVEQSVTVALELAGRACFMERGEIRFDGPSAQLLARRDLLRAVFLEGAAAARQR